MDLNRTVEMWRRGPMAGVIGATALQDRAPLITADEKFRVVPEL